MITHDASAFYEITAALARLGAALTQETGISRRADGGIDFTGWDDPVLKAFIRDRLTDLKGHLETIHSPVTMLAVEELVASIRSDMVLPESIRDGIAEVERTLRRELKTVQFLVLEPRDQGYFEPASPHYGQQVGSKFATEGVFEIDEAAKCLALSRPTAAIFHIARLMEIAIRAIARCLNIPDPVKPSERNWGNILRAIRDDTNRRWPNQADRMVGDGQLFVDFQTSLDLVKNAWRNPTMHVEKKYTDDEAEHIFVAVRGFMIKLAYRMDENGEPKA